MKVVNAMSKDIRDYGLGNYTKHVIGRPRVVKDYIGIECPNCHLEHTCGVEVVLKGMPQFSTRFAVGVYLGCPACPWASPCMIEPVDKIPEWWRDK